MEPTRQEIELIERNRLIFDFMGCTHSEDEAIDLWEMSGLKYHTSWDWLMPAVIKCKDIYVERGKKYGYPAPDGLQKVIDDLKFELTVRMDIEHIFYTVVRFVKWYNEQKTIEPVATPHPTS